jgi:DNA-binding response OmpR family regulator
VSNPGPTQFTYTAQNPSHRQTHLEEPYKDRATGQNESVLIVEDEPVLSQLLLFELTRAGYSARLAEDGHQALSFVQQSVPDLIILDWLLPGLDGLYVLRQIRNTIVKDPAVLMISARGAETDRIRSLDQGADDFLSKPFSLLELLARVRALLRRTERIKRSLTDGGTNHHTRLYHGELMVDAQARSASLSGEFLDLTRSEFDLLTYLMSHPGRSFTRSDLQEFVWHQCHVPGDRSVDNIVLRLRRKLGQYGGDLETVWGVGYRLIAR